MPLLEVSLTTLPQVPAAVSLLRYLYFVNRVYQFQAVPVFSGWTLLFTRQQWLYQYLF